MSVLGFEEALAAAIWSTLDAVDGITAYEHVPQPADAGSAAAFPYVTIGDMTMTDLSTDTEEGAEITIAIHIWSRYRGNKELYQQSKLVRDALRRVSIAVIDYQHVYTEFESSETLTDPDGVTRHAVQRYRVFLDETG